LWTNFCPDEIKIYPTQLLADTGLYEVWRKGKYTPYTTEQLIDLIADIKTTIPRYCRVNRVIRDIPSQNVVDGNKRTSLRQDIQEELARRGKSCSCIRCREVGRQKITAKTLEINHLEYVSNGCEEHFLSYDTRRRSSAQRIGDFLAQGCGKNSCGKRIQKNCSYLSGWNQALLSGSRISQGRSLSGKEC
jgi:histone acetyltransferase (RNA polymerase elongator complex component)